MLTNATLCTILVISKNTNKSIVGAWYDHTAVYNLYCSSFHRFVFL